MLHGHKKIQPKGGGHWAHQAKEHGAAITLVCIIVALVVILILVMYNKRSSIVDRINLLGKKSHVPQVSPPVLHSPQQEEPQQQQPPPQQQQSQQQPPQQQQQQQPQQQQPQQQPQRQDIRPIGNGAMWPPKMGGGEQLNEVQQGCEWSPPHFYTTTEGDGKESMSEAIAHYRTSMHQAPAQPSPAIPTSVI